MPSGYRPVAPAPPARKDDATSQGTSEGRTQPGLWTPQEARSERLVCDKCGSPFKTQRTLSQHVRRDTCKRQTEQTPNLTPSPNRPFWYSLCGRKLYKSKYTHTHIDSRSFCTPSTGLQEPPDIAFTSTPNGLSPCKQCGKERSLLPRPFSDGTRGGHAMSSVCPCDDWESDFYLQTALTDN